MLSECHDFVGDDVQCLEPIIFLGVWVSATTYELLMNHIIVPVF